MINIPRNDLPPEIYQRTWEFQRIASRGVHQAQEEARLAGVPNTDSINGLLHWELPDGSLRWVADCSEPVDGQGHAQELIMPPVAARMRW